MLFSTPMRASSTDSMLMSEATDLVGEELPAADERFVGVFFGAHIGEEEEEEEEEEEAEAAAAAEAEKEVGKRPPINAWYFFGKDSGNGALKSDTSAPNTGYALLSSSNQTVYLDPPSQATTQPHNISPDPCQFTKTR